VGGGGGRRGEADPRLAVLAEWRRAAIRRAFVRFDPLALGCGVGLLAGLCVLVATLHLVEFGALSEDPFVRESLKGLAAFFPGYHADLAGAWIGGAYAFAAGFVAGFATAAFRNLALAIGGGGAICSTRSEGPTTGTAVNAGDAMQSPIETIQEQVEAERLLESTLVRLNARILGLTLAFLGAASLFVATLVLLLRGGSQVGKHLRLLRHFFPGYDVTWSGLLLSVPYGAVVGFVAGYVVSRVYNLVSRRGRVRSVAPPLHAPSGKP
jgi:uncharacterized membrane protein (Fun14 family)